MHSDASSSLLLPKPTFAGGMIIPTKQNRGLFNRIGISNIQKIGAVAVELYSGNIKEHDELLGQTSLTRVQG